MWLEGFIVGRRTEVNRRNRVKAEQEERARIALERKKIEKEWEREKRDNIVIDMRKELEYMKQTLVSGREERRKLRLEVEELKRKPKEERTVKVIVVLTNDVSKGKVDSSPHHSISGMKKDITDVTLAQPNPIQLQSLSQPI